MLYSNLIEIYNKKPYGLIELNLNNHKEKLFTYDGYILIASNCMSDTVFTTENLNLFENDYALNNIKYGEPHPEKDYIIGDLLNYLNWNKARIISYENKISFDEFIKNRSKGGEWIDLKFPNASLTDITASEFFEYEGSSELHSCANYAILDSIRMTNDFTNITLEQLTIGASVVIDSSGDPSIGTYIGHGEDETQNCEGFYTPNRIVNSYVYTTWIAYEN